MNKFLNFNNLKSIKYKLNTKYFSYSYNVSNTNLKDINKKCNRFFFCSNNSFNSSTINNTKILNSNLNDINEISKNIKDIELNITNKIQDKSKESSFCSTNLYNLNEEIVNKEIQNKINDNNIHIIKTKINESLNNNKSLSIFLLKKLFPNYLEKFTIYYISNKLIQDNKILVINLDSIISNFNQKDFILALKASLKKDLKEIRFKYTLSKLGLISNSLSILLNEMILPKNILPTR